MSIGTSSEETLTIAQEFLTEMSEAGAADAVLAPWAVGSTVSLGLLDAVPCTSALSSASTPA